MPRNKWSWVPRDPGIAQNKYQNWIRIRAPGLDNNLASMRDKVVIQAAVGTVDAAGGTPEDWVDYLTGADGTGIYAEIKEPSESDTIIGLAHQITITHTITVRYDERIKEDMQVKWWIKGNWHYAKIHTIVPDTSYASSYSTPQYIKLQCIEHETFAEAYA